MKIPVTESNGYGFCQEVHKASQMFNMHTTCDMTVYLLPSSSIFFFFGCQFGVIKDNEVDYHCVVLSRWATTLPSLPATASPRISPFGKVGSQLPISGGFGMDAIIMQVTLGISTSLQYDSDCNFSFHRRQMEKQILGKINGDLASRDSEPDDSQVSDAPRSRYFSPIFGMTSEEDDRMCVGEISLLNRYQNLMLWLSRSWWFLSLLPASHTHTNM